jgi:hypothetical protein
VKKTRQTEDRASEQAGQQRRDPRGARIDLEFNYPMLPTQSALIARSLEGFASYGASHVTATPR